MRRTMLGVAILCALFASLSCGFSLLSFAIHAFFPALAFIVLAGGFMFCMRNAIFAANRCR